MNLKDKLTIIVLTYNEEIHLKRCLESLKHFKSNIFIIDSGSTDATLEIAEEYGAKVFINEFYSQKQQINWFLSKNLIPKKSWILRLDADEYLPFDSILKIGILLSDIDQIIGLVYLRLQRMFHGKHLKFGTLSGRYLPRLWRVGCAEFGAKDMDEKLIIKNGFKELKTKIDFYDDSLISPINFVIKHTKYAERQLLDIDNGKENKISLSKKIYYSLPFELSVLIMFLYRYLFRFGFLDGRRGLWYHFLQCFFYRNLIGIEKEIRNYYKGKNK